MKISVLAAAEFEAEPIAKAFNLNGPVSYHYTKVWKGSDFLLVQTNIGKVHAAAVTQLVIDTEHPDLIINVGISGGFAKEVVLGDVVMPTEVIQYDSDQTKLGYPLGRIHKIEKAQIPLLTIRGKGFWKKGLCITADKILSDNNEGSLLYKKFHPAVVDMELGAIAQVCYMNKVKLVALKSPVDIVEREEVASFTRRIDRSMSRLNEALSMVLLLLSKDVLWNLEK